MKLAAALLVACSLVPALVRGQPVWTPAPAAAPDAAARPCPPGSLAYRDGAGSPVRCLAPTDCQPPLHISRDGRCTCPPGSTEYRDGSSGAGVKCVASPNCPPGQQRDVRGQCRCQDGGLPYRDGSSDARCLPAAPCPPGARRDASSGACVCPPGSILYRDGQSAGAARCVPAHGERVAPSLPQPATLQPGR